MPKKVSLFWALIVQECSFAALNLHLWYTNWNVWYVYTQLDKISARYCLKEVLYEVQCLKSTEDMILTLAGQFKELSHEPEKLR